MIDPAAEWGNYYWKLDPRESNTKDTTFLKIDVYTPGLQFNFAVQVPLLPNDSIISLANYIDAENNPFIQLNSVFSDTTDFTPAQLDRWHVLFQPLPEAAIDGSKGYLWTAEGKDSLDAGEEVSFAIDVKNVFNLPMDSLLVQYYIEDEKQNRVYLEYPRQDSLRVGQSFRDTISFSTTNFVGENTFWMEVNPYVGLSNITDQPEQFHFNNLLQIPFNVRGDKINPLLDVTFDGRHILNGDIVNPNSEIVITLKDENAFLIMDNDLDTGRIHCDFN